METNSPAHELAPWLDAAPRANYIGGMVRIALLPIVAGRRWRNLLYAAAGLACTSLAAADPPRLAQVEGAQRRSVVLILVDDLRYDALGFMGHPFLETPHIDRLAKQGAWCRAACVTTALCSPSRASILTGRYAHRHRVVDNNNPVPPGTVFFPQHLQQAGYATGIFGKWHMGGASDEPQPGFDRWVSFRGQGTYLPGDLRLNIDGQPQPQRGYITDELTDFCTQWIERLPTGQPYFAYLSHKAVHANFVPAKRHQGRYRDAPFTPPTSMADTPENYHLRPRWVKDQRNSWHGVDFPYHGTLDVAEYYRRYCETLLAVDDSVGRLWEALERRGELNSTLILFMGDNGFCFGEHGLIDKRHAYEPSMRIPLVAHCPELIAAGTVVEPVVANLDIAPTALAAAGLAPPEGMDGRSLLPLLAGKKPPWREALLYEYYWERNFPHTPTTFALRTGSHKLIHYHGIWDIDELYEIEADPHEMYNVIATPQGRQVAQRLKKQLYGMLEETQGMNIPLYEDRGGQMNRRNSGGSAPGQFPESFYHPPQER